MSELFKNIIPGQRYLFYQKDLGNDNKIVKFRADFIDIINSTLRLTKFYCEERKVFINSRLLTMPLGWIVKIESLEDILENEVLLPKKYLLPENEIGSEVDVFVHKDSENRIVATTETPFILLGDFRYLTVIHVNPYGAFVDWGLEKDLLIPFREQTTRLEEDKYYLVF